MRSQAARANGFTLVELMVALAVAGTLLALAVPSFTGIINGSRLTGAANEMVAALQFARSEAIRINARVMLCRSTDGKTCSSGTSWTGWVVGPDANRDGKVDSVLRTGTVKGTVQIAAGAGFENSAIAFRSDGLARKSDGTLVASDLTICMPTKQPQQNKRIVSIASGSRISTLPASGNGSCS